MKKINLILVLGAVILFAACSDKKNNEIVSPDTSVFTASDFAVVDFTDVMNSVNDATLDADFTCDNSMSSYTFMNNGNSLLQLSSGLMGGNSPRMGNLWTDKFDFNKHLGRVLKQLNLTDDQKAQMLGFIKTFHDGMKPLVRSFNTAIKPILDSANVQRRAIVADLRAGKITRIEAQTKIKALNDATKALIESDPVVKGIKDQMCALRAQLLGSIESILTAEQKVKWTEWISHLTNPC
jgi:Spy/CpxP family protein refolding chaperone